MRVQPLHSLNTQILEVFEQHRAYGSVILQSALNGRYSIAAWSPKIVFEAYKKGSGYEIRTFHFTNKKQEVPVKPDLSANQVLEELYALWKLYRVNEDYRSSVILRSFDRLRAGLAQDDTRQVQDDTMFSNRHYPPFLGGFIGFFSYDFGVSLQGIIQRVRDDVGYPAVWFGLYDEGLVFDHVEDMVWDFNLNSKSTSHKLQAITKMGIGNRREMKRANKLQTNLTFEAYSAKIAKIKQFLRRGETYQVNFSRRFQCKTMDDPWEIYKRVTAINPSPYQMYLEGADFSGKRWAIVSNSPERLVRVYKSVNMTLSRDADAFGQPLHFIVESRPIKGTAPRGETSDEELLYRQKLLSSEKDKAELVMIVDLMRNDLGRVCKIGSVKVTEERTVEMYSHVQHTVANIQGVLRDGVRFVDVIQAVFPGGSITGCPKKRTISIIDQLEDCARGIYTGSAGYISFDGNMDFNIMIRTLFWKASSSHDSGTVFFHSGGGIVIDSDELTEYEETLHKAEALAKALAA